MKIKYDRKVISNTKIEVEFEISSKDLKTTYDKKVFELAKDIEMKGFRKGSVPKDMAEPVVGMKAQQNALEELIPKYATEILKMEKVIPAASLSYEIVSVDIKSGAKIKASIPTVPSFEIPDLHKIKIKKESSEVTKTDVDNLIKHLWTENRDKAENQDDKWVKQLSKKLGFKSSTMEQLRKELSDSIKIEKDRIVNQKYQNDIMSKAVELAKIELPEEMILMESQARENSFNSQIEQMHVSQEQYCKIRGVTMDQIRSQWRKDSEEALKNDLLLSKYSFKNGIKVSQEELLAEIENIRKSSPNVQDSLIDNEQWRSYIERVILKRKAFQKFLEEVDPETFRINNKVSKK